jgi:RND superfamily putative drug exporter
VATAKARWIVFGIWLVVIVGSMSAGVPEKYTDAQENESTSFLPGDAESTKALLAAEELQGGELAPAVILYRRESGLTAADKQKIVTDVEKLTSRRFPGVVADGATAAAGGSNSGGGGEQAPPAAAEGCGGPTTPIPGQPADYAPFVGPVCSPDGKAALVFAYIRGNGDSATLLDPSTSGATRCRTRAAGSRSRSPAARATRPTRSRSSRTSTARCCSRRPAS